MKEGSQKKLKSEIKNHFYMQRRVKKICNYMIIR